MQIPWSRYFLVIFLLVLGYQSINPGINQMVKQVIEQEQKLQVHPLNESQLEENNYFLSFSLLQSSAALPLESITFMRYR